jgi:hypothetical protein
VEEGSEGCRVEGQIEDCLDSMNHQMHVGGKVDNRLDSREHSNFLAGILLHSLILLELQN